MSAANKELSRRFTELFSTGDEALAEEILAPDAVFHGTTGDAELRGVRCGSHRGPGGRLLQCRRESRSSTTR
jgi:hypothetical protein